MIRFTIGGSEVYPAAGSNIKLTLENPYLKESGSHTYEITFPLDIPENRAAFGCVNRLDVSKDTGMFNDCRLYDGSRILLSGSGTVISYSSEAVKLQLLSASKSSRNIAMGRFLRDISFPDIDSPYKSWCQYNCINVNPDYFTRGFAGEKGKYAFFTVNNETTGLKHNFVVKWNGIGDNVQLRRPVIQPNLMYVLENVFGEMGYRVTENDFDTEPWNCLYIANLKRATKIQNALPNWKIETFLTEFCKLFNAILIYDDTNKTVEVRSFLSISSLEKVTFEKESSFETEFDDDGVSFIGSDNIRYELKECGDEKYVREIPADVLEEFTLRHYETLAQMNDAIAGMSEDEKKTSIFLCDDTGYRYYRKVDGQQIYEFVPCGFFTELIKEGNTPSSSTTDLNIIPAPIGVVDIKGSETIPGDSPGSCMLPCIDGPDRESNSIDTNNSPLTVQDVLEDGVSVDSRNQEDDAMQVVFLAEQSESFVFNDASRHVVTILKSFADQRESGISLPWSMALAFPGSISHYIGQHHVKSVSIDAHNLVSVRIFSDRMPDPKKIFVFDNKLFLCAKLEVSVNDNGVEPLIKGFFYEIL